MGTLGKRWTVGPEVQRKLWQDPDVRNKRLAARAARPLKRIARKCHYPGCSAIIETPPSQAYVKGCCRAHGRVPRELGAYTPDWPKVREQIYKRDGHRCRCCGVFPRRLEAHHLDRDRQNNRGSNLLTLCSRCHQGHYRRKAA